MPGISGKMSKKIIIKLAIVIKVLNLVPNSFIVETPIPKANNLKVTIGVAELVS
jgi:hypothetical protein